MPQDLSTVHANRALASMSVMLNNDQETYLLNRLCARRPVRNLSDIYFVHGRQAMDHAPAAGQSNVRFLPTVTGPGAPAPLSERTVEQKTYVAHRYSLKELVTDTEIQKSDDPLNPLMDAGKVLADRIRNDAEGVLAAIIGDAGNYPAANLVTLTTGANGTSWNKASAAGTGSEPLTDIRTGRIALEKIIQRPANVLALSAVTKYHLSDHDDLKNVLQYTKDDYLEGEGIPEQVRGLRMVTGKAVWNTAAEGAASAGDYIFVDNTEATAAERPFAIICYVPAERTIGVRGFSSFIYFDVADETTGQHGVNLRTWRDNDRRGYYVEAAITFDVRPGIVDSNSKITGAYFIAKAAIP
jgi:hypothetical protein